MKNYGKQTSTVKPDALEITASKVFVYEDIKKIEVKHEDITEVMYEFNLVEYDKDEYISIMSERNSMLEEEMTSTQMALCEVYELLG